jgi:PTS system, lactose/cellobiose family IIC component
MQVLEKFLLPLASKVQQNKYVSSISDGFALILPVIMIGAIFTLLSSMQLGSYQDFITQTGLKAIFGYPSKVTTDMLALYAAFAIAFSLTKKKDFEQDAAIGGTLAIVMLLILIPMGVSGQTDAGDVVTIAGALSTGFLGARGLFMAIIIGSIVPTIYCAVLKKGVLIKLPDSVPPTISRAFSALVPAFVVAIIFCIVRFIFEQTSFGDANTFVYSVVAEPLNSLGRSPISVIIFILFGQILWFFGLHGFMVILPFVQTIFLPLSQTNLSAFEAGLPLPEMITYQHFGTYVLMGGSGAVLGLAILMAFASKSKQFKTLGRLGIAGCIFGINEPIIFGVPLVLNTMLLIPFILVPITMFTIPYILQIIGFLPTLRGITMPLGTPVLFYGFVEGGVPIMLMQAVLIVVQVLMWFPFFKMADNKALELEKE